MIGLREDLLLSLDSVGFARRLGIEPDAWQEDVLRSEHPRVILNISRQAGKSMTAAIVGLHRALSVSRSLVLILAPSERQAKETFGKLAVFYRQLGHAVPSESYRKMGLELANGSRVEALPGTEKTVRGFSAVDLLILDEAGRVDDDLYHAIRPMLAVSGGRLLMMSTPYGQRGVFYEEWTHGIGWDRYEVPASQCPRIPAAFLEEERRSLPDWIFRQEYECSFEAREDEIFTPDQVDALVTDNVMPLRVEMFGG